MFGPHLVMEASGCSYEKLSDLNIITDLLNNLPDKMNMTKVMPAYVFPYKGEVAEDWGLSGIVIIAESHLAIHTFPDKGFLTVDIFSCKDFDVKMAVTEIVNAYQPKTWDEQLLMRGREFPKSLTTASVVLESERKQHFDQLVTA